MFNDSFKGILFMITCCAFYVTVGVIEKHLVNFLPFAQIVVLRYLSAVVVFLPYWLFHKAPSLKTNYLFWYVVRALCGACALCCSIYSFKFLHFSSVILLRQAIPLFLPLLGYLFLREIASKTCLIAIFVGFLGVAVVMQPGTDLFQWQTLFPIASAFFIACSLVFIRKMAIKDSLLNVLFYLNFVSLIIVLPFSINFNWKPLSLILLFWVGALGIIGIFAQIMLIKAYQHASTVFLAPFGYVSVLFSIVLDLLIWHRIPNIWFWLGTFLIIGSGLFVMRATALRYQT